MKTPKIKGTHKKGTHRESSKQPDFLVLKGNWRVFIKHNGTTELISEDMDKEIGRRRNSPKTEFITVEEFFEQLTGKVKEKK